MDFNWNSAKAAGKHVASFAAGSVAFAVVSGVISQGNADIINQDIGLISDGLKKIFEGFAGIVAVVTPIYTMWRSAKNATPKEQAIALTQAVPGTKVITTDQIARDTPEAPNVISQNEVKVVLKN